MNLLIGGDFYVSDRFRGKDLFDRSILALFADADFRIVNLEAPITAGAGTQRILKTGPHLKVSRETVIPLLQKLGIDLATLANNHIMDFGRTGLAETLGDLENAGIATVGAGLDLAAAARPFRLEKDGTRVAILNFGENEWASAERDTAGANPMDVIGNLEQIREAGKTCEFVIVIIHGGLEDYHFPTPRMVKQYRFYAENGASAVVGHHSHCVSGYEIHKGTPIFYGLGNFLFTQPYIYSRWYRGLVLTLKIQSGQGISWELAPVAQAKQDFTLIRMTGKPLESIRRDVEEYSRIIADEEALRRTWKKFLGEREGHYLNIFNPVNSIWNSKLRAALFALRLDRLFMRKAHYAEILNTLRCESHAEAAQGVIRRIFN